MDAMLLRPGDLVRIDPGRVERVYALTDFGNGWPRDTCVIHTDAGDRRIPFPFDVRVEGSA